MPKKRRNRRNKKSSICNKKSETEAEVAGTASLMMERDKTLIPPTISITNILSPIKATPSPKINNNDVKFHRNNEITLPTTPINREKSYRRSRINESTTTPNFSNINLLFNLESSPDLKPNRVNVATQTTNKSVITTTCDIAVQFNENDEITETPKINQLQFLDDVAATNKKLHSFERMVLQNNNVLLRSCNVNPYLKLNTEATEMSFFSSHFYNLKTASTPIKSPKSNNDIQALKKELLTMKLRCYKSASPKLNYYANHTKVCNRSRNISHLRPKSPIKTNITAVCRRITIDDSDCSSVVDNTIGAQLFSKVKKIGRFTAQWTMKFIELCWELGITIKKGFSAIQKYYKKTETTEPKPTINVCKCADFKAEIITLSEKINQLAHEMENNRKLAEDHQNTKARFFRDFNELKERLTALEEMKTDVQEMKKKLSGGGLVMAPPAPPPPPLLPPPPPPPPPPALPMFNSSSSSTKLLKVKKCEKATEGGAARPIISLDDILKVKLKKTSRDRSSPSLRTSQPHVSTDMLKQVKLRPASRSHTPAAAASTCSSSSTPSSLPTSPHSSLTRMLSSVDANVYKIKRLKRVSPYSFDDISRRNHLARLDRDRTN